MRRPLLLIVILLVAGAAVCVVVGAACDHYADFYEHESQPLTDSDVALWNRYAQDDWPAGPDAALQGRSFGYLERWVVGVDISAVYDIQKVSAGWPTRAVGYELWSDGSNRWGSDRWGSLRLRPIWFAFAISTVFYGAVLWLLVQGPFALRRVLRRRRGLCPGCGYPVGESATCTECGKLLAVRAVA